MPEKSEHELAIDDAIHDGDIDLVLETAPFYRLSPVSAEVIVDEVRGALASWPSVAKSKSLGRDEIEAIREALDA
jgi:hypothetical protein